MRSEILAGLAVLTVALAAPVLAADPMTMKPGESVILEPDGTATMLPAMTGPVDPAMKAASKPFETCIILMMGEDGKMYMVEDMAMADGTMVCQAMKTMN